MHSFIVDVWHEQADLQMTAHLHAVMDIMQDLPSMCLAQPGFKQIAFTCTQRRAWCSRTLQSQPG